MKSLLGRATAFVTAATTWAGIRPVFLAAAFLVPWNGPQQVPDTHAKTLSGISVNLPDAASGKPLLILVGFSHQSSGPCQAWDKRLSPLYLNDTRIRYYEAADFQGVPSLILRMILHGMKREVPANEHSRFLLLQADEDQWKNAAKYSAANEPYILLANASGHVVWQTHGAVTDEQFAALQEAVKKQLGN